MLDTRGHTSRISLSPPLVSWVIFLQLFSYEQITACSLFVGDIPVMLIGTLSLE